jgi:hypothetical protein
LDVGAAAWSYGSLLWGRGRGRGKVRSFVLVNLFFRSHMSYELLGLLSNGSKSGMRIEIGRWPRRDAMGMRL